MFLQINLIPWVRSLKKLESPKFLGNVQTPLGAFSSLGNVETTHQVIVGAGKIHHH